LFRAADGTIRLYVDPSCERLIESVEQTIYKAESRDIDKDMNIEHMADALGYPIELLFPMRKVKVGGRSR
jgi:phage terminase large subunit